MRIFKTNEMTEPQKIFIPLIGLLCVFACTSHTTNQTGNVSRIKKADSLIEETINRFNIPGLAVAITSNDTVIYEKAFGFRNVKSQEKITTKSVFHWVSVSKIFVATAVMQLVEQGKIKLEDNITTYLPYFKLKDNWYKNITVKQLLNHTSGIKDVQNYEWEKPQNDEKALERYIMSMKSDDMDFKNGKNFSYSNTGFDILGEIIAKASGMTFEAYVKKNIFEPLDMNSSSFYYPEIPESLRVTPHVWRAVVSPANIYPYNRIHAPSSTLNSSIEDMSKWAIANIKRGEFKSKTILSKKSYDLLWTKTVNVEDKVQMGLGWFLADALGRTIVCHSGSDPGFQSFILLCPEKNIAVVIVSNYDNAPVEDIGGSLFTLTLNKIPKTIKQAIVIPYTEKLKKEGLKAANKFYESTKTDTATFSNSVFSWGSTTFGLLEEDSTLKELCIILFRKNIEIYPKSSDAFFQLGYTYNTLGNIDSAKFYVEKALKINPKNEDALEFKKSQKWNK